MTSHFFISHIVIITQSIFWRKEGRLVWSSWGTYVKGPKYVFIHSFIPLSKSAKQRRGTGLWDKKQEQWPCHEWHWVGLCLAFTSRVVFSLKTPGPPHEGWSSLPPHKALSRGQGGNTAMPGVHMTLVRFRGMEKSETHWRFIGHLLFFAYCTYISSPDDGSSIVLPRKRCFYVGGFDSICLT